MDIVVPIIVGPTGIGKTCLSLILAENLPSEIISADSRQIYRYMDIGTAKADLEYRQKIKHHMIDIYNPDEYFSAGMFAGKARELIQNLISNGKVPIVVGGSGFYISALIDGIFEKHIFDIEIRNQLKYRAKKEGLDVLFGELLQCDPEYAERISANDRQRIFRSLEVYLVTGKPFSQWHKIGTTPAEFQYRLIGLNMERKDLYKRIEERVEKMVMNGLLDEVRHLQKLGYNAGLTSMKTVGYKEAFAFLKNEINHETMVTLIKQNTRRYAKRQLTWFRNDKRIEWNNITSKADLERLGVMLSKVLFTS